MVWLSRTTPKMRLTNPWFWLLLGAGLGCSPDSPNLSGASDHATLRPSRVTGIVSRSTSELVFLETQTGTIRSSREHPFAKVGSGWTRADELSVGDLLETSSGAPTQLVRVEHVSVPETPVFNLVVEGTHTYFAGESNLLVHNIDCPPYLQLTPEERRAVESYRDGTKLRPPPGSEARRRLDDLEYRARREDARTALRPALKDKTKPSRKKNLRWAPETYPEETPLRPALRDKTKPSTKKTLRWAPETYSDDQAGPSGRPKVNWTHWGSNPRRTSDDAPRRRAPAPREPGSSRRSNNDRGDRDPLPRTDADLTLDDWVEVEAYRTGVNPRPPPGTAERRRTDELERRVTEAQKHFAPPP